MGQVVLEQTGTVLERTSIVLDLLAVSRIDHACLLMRAVTVVAYLGTAVNYRRKVFITLAPGVQLD